MITAEINLVRCVSEKIQFEDVWESPKQAALRTGGCIRDQCVMRFAWDESFPRRGEKHL